MDSLSQIVLGAAVGEAILGRRTGNRAMLWGALCGTLPDLDVLANAVSDPMSALAYHRAFTHSLPFAVLAAPLVGLALHRFYGGREGPLAGRWVWPVLAVLFYGLLLGGSYLMPIEIYRIPQITGLITLVFALFFVGVGTLRWWRGFPAATPNASWRGWTALAFGAIVTHPLLDCFTAYGTQFLQPAAANRIAWNTISVADPLYTLPFLLLLLWARTQMPGWSAQEQGRGTPGKGGRRAALNRAGLLVSCGYLALTVVNYFNVDRVMTTTLDAAGIDDGAYVIAPTILNNVLWSGTVRERGTDVYYFSQYSLFDAERRFQPFARIEGHHDWVAPYVADRDMRILLWFTKGYYGVLPGRTAGAVQINDLRYGLLDVDRPAANSSYIFSWEVDTTVRPVVVRRENAGPGEDVDMGGMMERLWTRMGGNIPPTPPE